MDAHIRVLKHIWTGGYWEQILIAQGATWPLDQPSLSSLGSLHCICEFTPYLTIICRICVSSVTLYIMFRFCLFFTQKLYIWCIPLIHWHRKMYVHKTPTHLYSRIKNVVRTCKEERREYGILDLPTDSLSLSLFSSVFKCD